MKLNLMVLTLLATSSAMAATPAHKPVQAPLEEGCAKAIKTAVAALEDGYITSEPADSTIPADEQATIKLQSVVTKSACMGPADCSEKEPDAFTWTVKVGQKGSGLTGKVVVSYHRGNCFIESIDLKQ